MDREVLDRIEQAGLPNFEFSGGTVGDIISRAIPIIFFVAGIFLLIYLIYGGISMMTSGGDPKKAAGAKAILTNGAIGFTIIFLAYWIVQIIALVLGLEPILTIF